jgi:predicted CXXCH cytochrome family protein
MDSLSHWADPRIARLGKSVATLAALLAAGLLLVAAKPLHPYRTPAGVTKLLALGAHAGDCNQCHSMHGGDAIAYQHALLGPDDNTLCDRCHDTPWAGGSYAGNWLYSGSSHGLSSRGVWPGPDPPARTELGAAGKCLNCHDPHGWDDGAGAIPGLALGREERLCLTCHDGSPATTNIGVELSKPYRHPVTTYSGRHTGPAESQPTDFGAAPVNNRHSECVDCHNPHVAAEDRPATPPAPGLSRVNLGTSRVLVHNGPAGMPPTYTFVPASDTLTAPIAEYQLCFKCHSSWTNQPTGQTDLALQLNPANASYHPVEAAGTDPTIQPGAFVPGWSASSLTRCGDCHGSDFVGATRGPHGSSNRYILRQPYTTTASSNLPTAPDELCFSCHSYDVYANPSSPAAIRAYSRFNTPGAGKGHAEHVGEQNVPCFACHVTHGAADQRHLLITGRSPGIQTFMETAGGGTCQPTCHGTESYSVNYAR